MFSRKRVAAFATCSALVVSVPLYAQFGGLDAFKRVIGAATGQTPSTPATPTNSPSPSPTPVQDNASTVTQSDFVQRMRFQTYSNCVNELEASMSYSSDLDPNAFEYYDKVGGPENAARLRCKQLFDVY